VTTPVIFTCLLESNSAAKEWCAIKGILAAKRTAAIVKPDTMCLISALLGRISICANGINSTPTEAIFSYMVEDTSINSMHVL
jgi:uncharacterized membrane protein